jgi:uncharacterized membrane protein
MIKAIIVSLLVMFGLDYVWLHLHMADAYKQQFAPILLMNGDKIEIRMLAALVDYSLIFFATWLFAIRPGLQQSLKQTACLGFALGICLYGVYDMTSLALFKYWTWPIALIDCAWGGILVAVTALTGRYVLVGQRK